MHSFIISSLIFCNKSIAFLSKEMESECPRLFTTVPAQQGKVRISDYQIHYEIHGTGKTRILLIMGFMASMGNYKSLVHYFAHENGKEYSCLVLENRGYGQSTGGKFERYTTTGMANDVLHVLETVGWTDHSSIHCVGTSLGGMIAQNLVLHSQTGFKSLTLLGTQCKFRLPSHNPWLPFKMFMPPKDNDEKVRNGMNLLFADQDWLDSFDSRFPEFKSNRDRVYHDHLYLLKLNGKPDWKAVLGQLSAVCTHSLSPDCLIRLSNNVGSLIVFHGDHDQIIHHSRGAEIAKITNAKLFLLKNKGHALSTESCQEIIEQMIPIISN
jgi:pimeloyl-ACP methyl ester carboxylesterase